MSRAWYEVLERLERVQRYFVSALKDGPEPTVAPEQMAAWEKITGQGVAEFLRRAEKLWIVPEILQLLRAASGDVVLEPVRRDALPWPEAIVALPSEEPAAVFWDWIRTGEGEALRIGWVIGRDLVTNEPVLEGRELPLEPEDPFDVCPLLQALWLLIQQRVLVTEPVEPIRQARRQWVRRRGDAPIPVIQEITWRRAYVRREPDGEAHLVDWSHRWMVSGHWRQQWIPSESDHRQTWISPHIKGPAEKPLVLKERVNVWKR